MSNLHDHAMMLLRYMLEKGLIAPKDISPEELQAAVGLDKDDFDNADHFIMQSRFVEATPSSRMLTTIGIQYVTQAMKQRTPVTLVAERILGLLILDVKDDESPPMKVIIAELKITPQEYMEACQELYDLGYVTKTFSTADDYPELLPTKEGRLAFRKGFQEPVSAPSIQAGAIFTGPVTGANIQAIANAIGSGIQQNISALSPDELHKEIAQVLKRLIDQVSNQLTLQNRAEYTKLAAELQEEISKPKPEPGTLHKILARLGFLSDLDGAINLSQKTFELIGMAGPYISLLGQLILKVLQSHGH